MERVHEFTAPHIAFHPYLCSGKRNYCSSTTRVLLQPGGDAPLVAPCKSYTPLGALSSMQPPGTHVPPPAMSPSGRRHGCSSAFSAPPAYGPPPAHHRHPPGPTPPPPPDQPPPGYIHGKCCPFILSGLSFCLIYSRLASEVWICIYKLSGSDVCVCWLRLLF